MKLIHNPSNGKIHYTKANPNGWIYNGSKLFRGTKKEFEKMVEDNPNGMFGYYDGNEPSNEDIMLDFE